MFCKVAVLPKENINIVLFIVEHFFTSTSVDVKMMFLLLFNWWHTVNLGQIRESAPALQPPNSTYSWYKEL